MIMTRSQAIALSGGVVLVLVALFAGEYSTLDWLKLRHQLAQERDTVVALRVAVDSLRKVVNAIENDPATQERVAREQFGMIRDGETLYRIIPNP